VTKNPKPLVLFAGLPIVLRKLRGENSVQEVAAGAGLAKVQREASPTVEE
jgi:hypothetical protein